MGFRAGDLDCLRLVKSVCCSDTSGVRFVTLFVLLAEYANVFGMSRACPCVKEGEKHHSMGSCPHRLPYNWVLPHDASYSVRVMRDKKYFASAMKFGKLFEPTSLPKKPVVFRGRGVNG